MTSIDDGTAEIIHYRNLRWVVENAEEGLWVDDVAPETASRMVDAVADVVLGQLAVVPADRGLEMPDPDRFRQGLAAVLRALP